MIKRRSCKLVNLRAVRAYVDVEADEPVKVFTGQLVKTLILALSRETRLFHGVRGIISPLHISPLFTEGKREFELGRLISPIFAYDAKNGSQKLYPAPLSGEYLIHIGGIADAATTVEKALERLKKPLAIRYRDNIIEFSLEKEEDITEEVASREIEGDKLTLYLKGPVKPFNVFSPSRLPKFSPSAYEVLMVGYLLHRGVLSVTYKEVLEAMKILGLLVETYYSLNTIKPILVPFKKGKEPAMIGKITYIVDTKNKNTKMTLARILNASEIGGVGESRANGFGTVTWSAKY